jgi:hypothetical protein
MNTQIKQSKPAEKKTQTQGPRHRTDKGAEQKAAGV